MNTAATLTAELDAQSENVAALSKLWNASFGSVNRRNLFSFIFGYRSILSSVWS